MKDYILKLRKLREIFLPKQLPKHLKIETRLKIEKFTSVMGEYVTER
jgi:hypothetical protein